MIRMPRVKALLPLALALACQKPPPATDPATAAAPPPPAETQPEPQPELPDAQAILDASVDAIGGRAKLAAIASYHSTSQLEVTAQNLSATVELWWKAGNFFMQSDMPGVGVSKVWKNGEEIWAEDPVNGKRKLEGTEAAQASWSASLSLAADWQRYFDAAKTVAVRKIGDREVVDVQLRDDGGPSVTLTFDAATHMPVEQSFEQATPMGNLPVRTSFEDYREVAGVQTPFRSVTSMSLFQSVTIVTAFEPNVDIDDAKFTP